MALVSVRYIGSTSSGRMHKYELISSVTPAITDKNGKVTTPESDNITEIKAALKGDKVVLNTNVGDRHFLSPTHLHLTPTVGDECEVDVRAFQPDPTSDFVNYFHGIDHEAQKSFAKAKVVKVNVAAFAQVQKALDNAGIDASTKEFMEYQLLEQELAIKRLTFQRMNVATS